MRRTHLYPSRVPVGRPISPFSHSYIADMNRQNSPTISETEQGNITQSTSNNSSVESKLSRFGPRHQELRRTDSELPTRSSSLDSRRSGLSTDSRRASSLWSESRQSPLTDSSFLNQELDDLRLMNVELERKYEILEAHHETLRDAYNGLLQAVRRGSASVEQDDKQGPPERREDYPNVRFWTRRDWLDRSIQDDDAMVLGNTSRRGKSRASQGVNVAMRYVENEEGIVADGHRCAEMRRYARSIWVHMANNGGPPTSWGKADVKLSQSYCREMHQRFSELRLCDLDWKADQIATDNYPSWYKNWMESMQRAGGMKQEQGDQTLSDTGVSSNHKRPNMQPPDHAAKKLKVNTDLPEPAKIEVDTNTLGTFQIKNHLTNIDLSKLSVMNSLSTPDPKNGTPGIGNIAPTAPVGPCPPGFSVGQCGPSFSPLDPPTTNIRGANDCSSSRLDHHLGNKESGTLLHDMTSSHNNSTAMVSQTVLDKGVVANANIPQITIKSVVSLTTDSDLAANPSPALSTHLVAASHISGVDLDGGPVGADMVTMGEKSTISIDSVADAASPFVIMPTTISATSPMAISTTTAAPPMVIDSVANAASPFMIMPTTTATPPMTTSTTGTASVATMSTATAASVTSSQPATILTHEHGSGTAAAAIATTKKKAPAKKRTTNSNTPKNLCARDWVPAVGGTTEEFDRYWDALPGEDKKKYIEKSKQLKLSVAGSP